MRSHGSVQLETWATAQGGVRAAASVLGVAPATISRWIGGKQVPRGDGDRGPGWLEERTGVPATSWDQIAPASGRAAARRAGPAPVALPRASAPPTPRRRAAKAPAAHVAPPSPRPTDLGDDEEPPPPATLPELQRRANQIPAELARLRRGIATGVITASAGEIMARMLEREGRRVDAAINAAGTATVQEVEQLRALMLDVTRGCESCRERVSAALRGGAG